MKKTSQADRVLRVLKDGAWHDIAEIHWHAGPMRLNSRVADLRRRGLHIEHSFRQGRHGYQLFKADALPRNPWPLPALTEGASVASPLREQPGPQPPPQPGLAPPDAGSSSERPAALQMSLTFVAPILEEAAA